MTLITVIKKTFNWDQMRFSPLLSPLNTWLCTGKHGAFQVAKSSTSASAGSRKGE